MTADLDPTDPSAAAHRLKREIQSRMQARSLNYHSRVSASRRYMCMTVPKVACTTVKLILQRLEDPGPAPAGDESPDVHGAHEWGTRLGEWPNERIHEALTSHDWFRFCFVRNPYDRVYSAYKSKVITRDPEYLWLRRAIRVALRYPGDDDGQLIAFHDFIQFLRYDERPDVRYDGHLCSQSHVLIWDLVHYDFVGRFERFAIDFRHALHRIGAPEEIMGMTDRRTNETPDSGTNPYNDRLAGEVHQLYEEDFANFGYDPGSWLKVRGHG